MRYRVTPLCMTAEFMPDAMRSSLFEPQVGYRSNYEQRVTKVIVADDEQDALDKTWQMFQNLHKGHLTPDGKRSLMTGDIIKVEDESGKATLHLILGIGFRQIDELKSLIR